MKQQSKNKNRFFNPENKPVDDSLARLHRHGFEARARHGHVDNKVRICTHVDRKRQHVLKVDANIVVHLGMQHGPHDAQMLPLRRARQRCGEGRAGEGPEQRLLVLAADQAVASLGVRLLVIRKVAARALVDARRRKVPDLLQGRNVVQAKLAAG